MKYSIVTRIYTEILINQAVDNFTSSRFRESRITVKVTKPTIKMTAKQKKCKHSWKTLKKANCQRVGTKVCKKCKLQKTVKKTNHKWETITSKVPVVTDVLFESWYGDEFISDTTIKLSDYIPTEQLARVRVTADYEILGLPEGTEEAEAAFFEDCYATKPQIFGFRAIYGDEWIDETNTICEYCGKSK